MEKILQETRQYYVENKILRSEVKVIDRLQNRQDELRSVNEELDSKLTFEQKKHFAATILSTTAFWSPEQISELRNIRDTLEEVNDEIADTAKKLARLLRKRSKLESDGGFLSTEDYSIHKWLDRATEQNHLYKKFVKEKIDNLKGQFDLKYWPEMDELIRAIAHFAGEACVQPLDPLTSATLETSRTSKADFLRAFFTSLEELKDAHPPLLPVEFKLSDKSVAILVSCLLDLSVEELIDANYVKRARQRIRERAQNQIGSERLYLGSDL
ncbi:hypothetical protein [uncultured Sneathiella sp.]|jgi:hypothetical protein|uniref:hypothetical protein n=1 Tax=uncultured Sneathiella sp. TaxID=879315 RepID=UPI0030D7FB7A|tara:strand:+ start:7069 stop:7878 length:810 start_codon:yes stop_codon:yes gene_type:complete